MIFKVKNQQIEIIDTELVSGSSGLYTAEFEFSDDWNEFHKIAKFQLVNGGSCYDCTLTDNQCIIPWEAISQPNQLKVGIYGVKGNIVKPTVWSTPIFVDKGCGSAVPAEPSQSLVDQILDVAQSVRDDADAGLLDGYSPEATVERQSTKAVITITDKYGTTSAEVNDGEAGTIDSITASIDDSIGVPLVVVTESGTPEHKQIDLAFKNLRADPTVEVITALPQQLRDEIEIVTELPPASEHLDKIYLIAKEDKPWIYDEWIWLDDWWDCVGQVRFNLLPDNPDPQYDPMPEAPDGTTPEDELLELLNTNAHEIPEDLMAMAPDDETIELIIDGLEDIPEEVIDELIDDILEDDIENSGELYYEEGSESE